MSQLQCYDTQSDRAAEHVNDFCRAVGIGRTKFYEEVREGRIRIVKAGKRTLVPIAERANYLARLSGVEVAQ